MKGWSVLRYIPLWMGQDHLAGIPPAAGWPDFFDVFFLLNFHFRNLHQKSVIHHLCYSFKVKRLSLFPF